MSSLNIKDFKVKYLMYNSHTLSMQSFVKMILMIRKLLTHRDSHVW